MSKNEEFLSDLKRAVGENISGFEVRYKDKNWSSKLLGFLARPFNNAYMTRFTTTRYPRVYFPSKEFVDQSTVRAAKILAHESVHLDDRKRIGIWHNIGYALPQIAFILLLAIWMTLSIIFQPESWWVGLVLIGSLALAYGLLAFIPKKTGRIIFWSMLGTGVVAFLGLAIWQTTWWTFLLGAAIICASPLPAWWRAKAEFRGYSMNLAFNYWRYGSVETSTIDWITENFIGPNYYFMWPFRNGVRRRLNDTVGRLELGTMTTGKVFGRSCKPYQVVYDLLKQKGLLKD